MRNKSKKIAFTLVEMLIVVVIIGILAAALIPRLTGAQERSRDAARKAHLNQLVAALSTYNSENGQFPGTGCGQDSTNYTKDANNLSGILIPNFIKSMPTDPQINRTFVFVGNGTTCGGATTPGNYAYTPLQRNGANYAGMIVGANVETPGKNNSNYIGGSAFTTTPLGFNSAGCVQSGSGDAVDLEQYICKSGVEINKSATNNTMGTGGTSCIAKSATNIMYVMIQ